MVKILSFHLFDLDGFLQLFNLFFCDYLSRILHEVIIADRLIVFVSLAPFFFPA